MRVVFAVSLGAVMLAALLFSARAQDFETAERGQPFCGVKDELHEMLLAMVKRDQRWMNELTSCYMLPSGVAMAVIETYANSSVVMHVLKVRVFSPERTGSAVGYTIDLGLKPKK